MPPLPAPLPLPTRALSLATLTSLLRRQSTQGSSPSIIPANIGNINSGPAPGAVVGIVLGSVAGFMLVLWLIYTIINLGSSSSSSYTESAVVVSHPRRKSHHGSHGTTRTRSHRGSRTTETVEVRRAPSRVRSRSPAVRIVREPERVERVIVQEEIRRDRTRSRSSGPGSSDEVVVIEEHSPPRRKKSNRHQERDEPDSGYRTVDPGAYAGAVGGRKSSSRRGGGR